MSVVVPCELLAIITDWLVAVAVIQEKSVVKLSSGNQLPFPK